MRALLLISFVAILAGCASTYVEPSSGVPAAQLIVKDANFSSAFGSPKGQFFEAFFDDSCSNVDGTGRIAAFGRYSSSGDKTFRIPPNKRFFIRATVVVHTGAPMPTGTMIYSNYCTSLISFVPEAGHQYVVLQAPDVQNCSTGLVEADSGRIPSTFSTHSVNAACKFMQK